jgi:hypothetical protein
MGLDFLECRDRSRMIIVAKPCHPMVGLHPVCYGAHPKWMDLALGGIGGPETQPAGLQSCFSNESRLARRKLISGFG